MVKNNFDLVFMTTEDTVEDVIKHYDVYLRYINAKRIVLVGPKSIMPHIENTNKQLVFLDEDSILNDLTYQNVYEAIYEIDQDATGRCGWYLQQFLKMAYAYKCKDDYYLVWDSDTLPLHEISMIDSHGKVCLDVKSEYNKPYFETIKSLGIAVPRIPYFSFISEHMLIEKRKMIELINIIEKRKTERKPFWKNIISQIQPFQLGDSGFSEFETYGNYVYSYYKDDYVIRKWKSLRSASMFYDEFNENLIERFHIFFDAISFENKSRGTNHIIKRFSRITLGVVVYEYSKEAVKKIVRVCNVL